MIKGWAKKPIPFFVWGEIDTQGKVSNRVLYQLPDQTTNRYNTPMPTNPDPTQETYNTYAPQIAERYWETDLTRAWEAFSVLLKPDAIVADLGCGPGRDTGQFSGRGFRAIGMDYSYGMLLQATERAPASYVQGDLRNLSFASGAFHGAWVNASLLHIPREQVPGVLCEVRRILKKDGVLYLGIKEGQGEIWEQREGMRFFTFFQREEIQTLLETAGFKQMDEWLEPAKKVTWINILARAS